MDSKWLATIIENARRDLDEIAPEIKAHSPKTRYEQFASSAKKSKKPEAQSTSTI